MKDNRLGRRLAAAGLVLGAAPAAAQMPYDTIACFGRAYTAEHLAAHPGQSVVEMQVVLDAGAWDRPPAAGEPAMVAATVRATVRDRFGEFFANAGSCEWDAGLALYDCGIECDGGRFQIVLDQDGTALLRNGDWGFVLYGGCGEEVEAGREVTIPADAEHAAFRLYPVPVEACPIELWTLYDRPF